MELKELKCKNCGAKVEVDENATQATCKYCNTTFAIEDEYSAGYKYTKGVLKAKDEQYEKDIEKMKKNPAFKIMIAIIITIIIISILIFIFVTNSFFKMNNDNFFNKSDKENISDKIEDTKNDADYFNFTYYGMNGTKSKFFIERYLDNIVTNNKTNKEHLISVKYLDKETSNPDEIIEIKKSLVDGKEYELSMDYDKNGYFNKLTITE